MELYLAVNYANGEFIVNRKLSSVFVQDQNSVIILYDWPYTPWTRDGGDLLWH